MKKFLAMVIVCFVVACDARVNIGQEAVQQAAAEVKEAPVAVAVVETTPEEGDLVDAACHGKFKMGDTVDTVAIEQETNRRLHGVVATVAELVDPDNNQCVYEVVHLIQDQRITLTYWEFELQSARR